MQVQELPGQDQTVNSYPAARLQQLFNVWCDPLPDWATARPASRHAFQPALLDDRGNTTVMEGMRRLSYKRLRTTFEQPNPSDE